MSRLATLQRLGRLPLRALATSGADVSQAREVGQACLLFSSSPYPGQDEGAASQNRTQLLMLGSYAVSTGFSEAHAHIPVRPTDSQGEAAAGRTQLLMDGDTVTSGAYESSSSSAEEEAARADPELEDIKYQLLEAALTHVKEAGWTVAAVRQAAADLQLSPAAVAAFTRPEAELVKFFVDDCNRRLRDKLEQHHTDLQALRTTERLRTAIRWRLEMLIPYMDTWPQALAVHTSPGSLPHAIRQVGELVDDIWHASGDKSADYDWYAKRGVLAALYTATEAYMLTDYSPGFADTWEALDRRLDELEQLGRLTGRVREAAGEAIQRFGASIQWAQDHFTGSRGRGF